jgi:NAD(P)H dehydrogenase (quinone)
VSRQYQIGRMRVLVVYCHPVAESFAAAAHRTVLEALAEAGHEVTDVDLYAEHFDPVMSRQERLDYLNTERNERLVKRYDDQLVGTEALVLIYPAWWYGMPAMLKGYFDRVWLPGVAFDVTPDGTVKTDRLKALRRILVVTTYGGPWWMVRIGLGDPARKIVSRAVRSLCARNCRVTWCVHYNMDRAKPPELRRFLQRVRRAALRLRTR